MDAEQRARERAASLERAERQNQIHAEASQALPSIASEQVKTASDVRSNQDTSLESTPFKQEEIHVVKNQGNDAVHELKIQLNDGQNLNKSLEGQLRAAEDHIADLEQKLEDANSTLTAAILQDEDEQIRKQQRVIRNLREQLDTVEDERKRLRKQFQESELKVWQLKRAVGRLEHRDAGGQGQADVGINHTDIKEGMSRHDELKCCQGQRESGKAGGQQKFLEKSTSQSKKELHRNGYVLWTTT